MVGKGVSESRSFFIQGGFGARHYLLPDPGLSGATARIDRRGCLVFFYPTGTYQAGQFNATVEGI